MRRVVLTHLPGLNYFIGTFDLVNYRVWWRSTPLPGAIQTIEHALWVGGPMHLCLAKMVDGTWSIFLSSDYGVNWQLVKNSVAEIMDIELVTFTWILYSDANGDWWESTNSGFNWTKVCTGGPVGKAFFVMHKGDTKTVYSHDGRYIKKSTNLARTWTTASDLNTVDIAGDSYKDPMKYTGSRVPAIAGANGVIHASNGPYLAWSLDDGTTFTSSHSWDNYYGDGTSTSVDRVLDYETNTVHSCFPPTDIVQTNRANFDIVDLVISSIDGPLGGDVAFVLLTRDKNGRSLGNVDKRIVVANRTVPTTGKPASYPASKSITSPLYKPKDNYDFLLVDEINTISDLSLTANGTVNKTVTLFSDADWISYNKSIYVRYEKFGPPLNRIFKTFSGEIAVGADKGDEYLNFWYKFIYQQTASLGELELSSYQLLTPGGTTWDRLLFSAMKSTDSNGNPVINLQYSTDGGRTYQTIDISQIEVYSGNPDEEPDTAGGAFTYLDYSNVVWVSGQCNNHGHWDYDTGHKIQMLSYDIDGLVGSDRLKTYNLSTRIILGGSQSYDIETVIARGPKIYYDLNAYVQRLKIKPYLTDCRVQKERSNDYNMAAYLASIFDLPYNLSAYINSLQRIQYYLNASVQGPKSKFYSLDAIVTDSVFDEMGVGVERRIQQAWSLVFKMLPKPVYDSRRDPESD